MFKTQTILSAQDGLPSYFLVEPARMAAYHLICRIYIYIFYIILNSHHYLKLHIDIDTMLDNPIIAYYTPIIPR